MGCVEGSCIKNKFFITNKEQRKATTSSAKAKKFLSCRNTQPNVAVGYPIVAARQRIVAQNKCYTFLSYKFVDDHEKRKLRPELHVRLIHGCSAIAEDPKYDTSLSHSDQLFSQMGCVKGSGVEKHLFISSREKGKATTSSAKTKIFFSCCYTLLLQCVTPLSQCDTQLSQNERGLSHMTNDKLSLSYQILNDQEQKQITA